MDLTGKNVIYEGGFGGIGQCCLREFLERGVKVKSQSKYLLT